MTNRSKQAHQNKTRPARVPLTAGNKLHVPAHLKREGYQQYFAINRKGMIEQMEAAYYEKVLDDQGKPYTIPAGNGDLHYLMEIEQKYYDEDIKAQQDRNIDATAKQAQTLGEEEYVPMGKSQVAEREII
jgi:hypothetical protein